MKSILYKPILILVIVEVFFLSRTAISQVTNLNNTNPTGVNFIGWNNTGPSTDLNFRTNNVQRMTLTQNVGRLGLGVSAPASMFHLADYNSGNLFRTDGALGNVNRWDMFTGPNATLLQRRFSLFVDPSNGTPPYMVNLQAEWGPMQFVTANGTNGSNLSSRMRINGYNVGNTLNGFTNQITSGFVGISADPTFWTAGTSTQTPASLLHLVGDFNGHNPFAYRPWMKNGISFTLGWDQGFIGPRLVNDENDVMEFVVGWGDNASTYGPDVMSFRFLANEGGGGQDLLGEDLDGREILRMGGSGNIRYRPQIQ